ncbi:MAG: Citrate transporter [Syntrophorhabdus sp. PtaB.Bin047]|jgi:Na+/H+ antiporter NhaD/arsenite permease-like protein|nr:MAG: Citrate transporter [Syntrophorhabdus sp. PtaB.Bin047]
MDFVQTASLVIFLASIILVITGWIDSVLAALLGILFMVFFGIMSDLDAFKIVDWNVIIILLSIWIISGYFGKSGVPDFLSAAILKLSKGNVALFVTMIGALAGFVSMLIDNVVVVLMFAPVIFHACRRFKFKAFGPVLFLALCANFMGTAMLLGDLPPQMLHSVSGIEFSGFIWQLGRPSSLFILLISYAVTCWVFYLMFRRSYKGISMDVASMDERPLDHIKDKPFAIVVCVVFALTILAMALRPIFGYHLGFIAMWGAICLILIFEIFKDRFTLEIPSLEHVLSELDWRAVFFYVALFALVGGLEHSGVIKLVSNMITPLIKQSLVIGSTLLFWVTAPIVGIVEHDAYILTMLYVIRDLAKDTGMNPWPLYWMLLWAGTLGSNLTIAGAPALFVAKNLAEKEDETKIPLKSFLGMTVPYVIVSLIACYIPAMLIWVFPFAK